MQISDDKSTVFVLPIYNNTYEDNDDYNTFINRRISRGGFIQI